MSDHNNHSMSNVQRDEEVAQPHTGMGANGGTRLHASAHQSEPLERTTTPQTSQIQSKAASPERLLENEKEKGKEKETPSAPEASRTKWETSIIMACLMLSVFLAALDTTIITVALPTITEHFHSEAGYTWVGSAYLLANAASTPSWGKFSDIWGRKPILLLAATIFFIGSMLAGLSVNIGMLIVARAIQGLGGGGLIVMANICISDLFSLANRGLYYGFLGMVWAVASAIGPIVGGAFTEKVTWRWCFYVNLPITGSVWILLFFFLHLESPKTPVLDGLKAVDWLGALTIVGGTLMLLLGLEFGGVNFPWDSAKVILLIIFGVVVLVLFVLNEWKLAKYPIMPLGLFKHVSNVASLGVCFCHGFVFISGSYYLPLYFQAVLGSSPLLSGVWNLPWAMSLSLTSAFTGIFIKKTGKYLPPIYFGLTVMTVGFGLFIDLPLNRNWTKLVIYQIVAGMGVGPLFQAPLIALQSKVQPRDIATATATFGFIRNLSTAISVVIGAVVFENQLAKKKTQLTVELGPEVAQALSGGSAGASVGVIMALPAAQRAIAQEAFWSSLKDMWIVYVAFTALGLVVSVGIGQQVLSKEHSTVQTGLAAQEQHRRERKEEKKQQRRISGEMRSAQQEV